jgi:hypothetical protein
MTNCQNPAKNYHELVAALLNMHLIELTALIVPSPKVEDKYCTPKTIRVSETGTSSLTITLQVSGVCSVQMMSPMLYSLLAQKQVQTKSISKLKRINKKMLT